TDIGPTTNAIDMSGMNRPFTRSVYLLVLDKSLPSPLAPESDEEKDKAKDKADDDDKEKADKPAGDKTAPKAKPIKVDLGDVGQRALALPLPARNYLNLQAGKAGFIYLTAASGTPMAAMGEGGGLTVTKFDLGTRKSDP